jgi:hypothetical protein
VFLLFLDCVYQLIVQNPFAFEFTDYFLLELYHDVCYCYHHTFAFNNVIERLEAIYNCPRNLLVLSSFDFSLYLYPDACRLLKNDASIFNIHKPLSNSQQSKKNPPPPRSTSSIHDTPSIIHGLTSLNAEHCEYDTIESPQRFSSDLHVDWRIFNIVLWSKCYCRYDQNYIMPTLPEQQLSLEISCLQEDIKNARTKSRRPTIIDTFQSVNNSVIINMM